MQYSIEEMCNYIGVSTGKIKQVYFSGWNCKRVTEEEETAISDFIHGLSTKYLEKKLQTFAAVGFSRGAPRVISTVQGNCRREGALNVQLREEAILLLSLVVHFILKWKFSYPMGR